MLVDRRTAAVRTRRLGRLPHPVALAADDRYLGAAPRQLHGRRATDAPRRAGDQDHSGCVESRHEPDAADDAGSR